MDRTQLVQMIRCSADANHKTSSPVWEKHTFVSQQSWTAHQSAEMQPQLWNKSSLPWETVPLYCHCCSWMSLVVISHGGDLNGVDTWAQKGVTITNRLVKHLLHFQPARTHIHKNAAGQDNKAKGLKFPMYVLTALHFLFTVVWGGGKGPCWDVFSQEWRLKWLSDMPVSSDTLTD